MKNIKLGKPHFLLTDEGVYVIKPKKIDMKCIDPELTATFVRRSPDHGKHWPGGRPKKTYGIVKVIFNDPATVVIWSDGTKTVVKCQEGDTYSKETGLALCIAKKYLGNKGNFNEVFKKWIPEEVETIEETGTVEEISVEEMRVALEEYCDATSNCRFCPLKDPCRCGRGAFFTTKSHGKYDMSDDEIRDTYRIAFLEK